MTIGSPPYNFGDWDDQITRIDVLLRHLQVAVERNPDGNLHDNVVRAIRTLVVDEQP
jgi:hypothetical protein